MSRFSKPLQDFVASAADFKTVYNTGAGRLITPATKRICVLDSSFNPPHLGHYALMRESLNHKYPGEDGNNRVILLLLSINNADKQPALLGAIEHRLNMMYYMANDLAKTFPQAQNVSIGLTKHARFVDKSFSILHHVQEDNPAIKLTFLVGFDTLVRIFNPNYYLPDKLTASLDDFMKSTDLFCLTRNDSEISHSQQSQYVQDISHGKHEHIPQHWSDNIVMMHNQDDIGLISSSNVRASIHDTDQWENKVLPEVRDYILREKLYKE